MTDKGKRAEEILASIVAAPLFYDFVHLRPAFDKGGRQTELCDLLIEDEGSAILIQLKMQDADKAKPGRDAARWALKQLKKASSQVQGAARRLPLSSIEAWNPMRGRVTFAAGSTTPSHGVVVLDYSGPELGIPNLMTRRTRGGIPIHYLSHHDMAVLTDRLMSLPDFRRYLDQRSRIPSWATPNLAAEKDVYAYYLMHRGEFTETLKCEDFTGQWDRLTSEFSEQYREKTQEDEKTEIYNHIIRYIHDQDPNSKSYAPALIRNQEVATQDQIVEVARRLNRLRALERRQVSEQLLEKIRRADTVPLGFSYFAYRSEDDEETYYLFLASSHVRTSRIEELINMAGCVFNITPARFVVGVATESAELGKPERSYDFIMADERLRDDDPQTIENCRKLFKGLEWRRIHDFPSEGSRLIIPGQ